MIIVAPHCDTPNNRTPVTVLPHSSCNVYLVLISFRLPTCVRHPSGTVEILFSLLSSQIQRSIPRIVTHSSVIHNASLTHPVPSWERATVSCIVEVSTLKARTNIRCRERARRVLTHRADTSHPPGGRLVYQKQSVMNCSANRTAFRYRPRLWA